MYFFAKERDGDIYFSSQFKSAEFFTDIALIFKNKFREVIVLNRKLFNEGAYLHCVKHAGTGFESVFKYIA